LDRLAILSTKNDGFFDYSEGLPFFPTWAGVALKIPDGPIYAQKTTIFD